MATWPGWIRRLTPHRAWDTANGSDRSPEAPPRKSLHFEPSFSSGDHDDAPLQKFAAKCKTAPLPTRDEISCRYNSNIRIIFAANAKIIERLCRAVHFPEHALVSQNKSIDALRLTKRAICRIKRSSIIVFASFAHAIRLSRSRNKLFFRSFFLQQIPFLSFVKLYDGWRQSCFVAAIRTRSCCSASPVAHRSSGSKGIDGNIWPEHTWTLQKWPYSQRINPCRGNEKACSSLYPSELARFQI